jgi:ribose transport system substrate-binding protein
MSTKMTRRNFLRSLAAGTGAGLLAACGAGGTGGGAATSQPAASGAAATAAPPAQGNKKLLFVWSPKATNNPVFDTAKAGGDARAEEMGFDFQWVGPSEADAQKQVQLLEDVISKGCDGMGVSCNNADALKPTIDRAVDKGIPVITWDSDSPSSKRLTFYSFDTAAAGGKAGELFVAAMKDNPSRTYALLTGVPGAPNLEERIKAVRAVVDKPENNLTWVATEACNDDIQKGAEVVENRMTATPDLGGWVMIGGWPLFGDVKAMPKLVAAKGKTKVVAWDTLPSELKLVQDGLVQGLIGQKYYGWGYDATKLLYDIIVNKKQVGAFTDSGFDVVTTADQATDFLKKWETKNFK